MNLLFNLSDVVVRVFPGVAIFFVMFVVKQLKLA